MPIPPPPTLRLHPRHSLSALTPVWPFQRGSAHTYYVCYNQVSYLVAGEHAMLAAEDRPTILAAFDRVVQQPRFAGIEHRPLNRWQTLLACLQCLTLRRVVVYLPHDRTGRLLQLLGSLSGSVRLVDDGLDTLREKPKNVRLDRLARIDELLTFTDYDELAGWTTTLRVTRVCSLAVLLNDSRPALVSSAYKTLVVQSPGVLVADAVELTNVRPREVFVFVHGNPAKRSAIPVDFVQGASDGASIERTVASFEGTVLTGETMVTVFALFCAPRVRLVVQLSAEQYDNLACLHNRLRASGARVVIRQD